MNLQPQEQTVLDVLQLPWLKGQTHLIHKTGGITLSAAAVTADGNGDKLVPSGTIVGRASGTGKYQPVGAAVVPSITINDAVAEGGVVITLLEDVPATIEVVDSAGADDALSVTVTGYDIVVNRGMTAGSADDAKNTATLVAAALTASGQFAAFATAAVKTGDDGSGVVAVLAETAITETTELEDFVLVADLGVNLKSADAVVGALHGAKVDEALMPDAVNGVVPAAIKAKLPQVIWD